MRRITEQTRQRIIEEEIKPLLRSRFILDRAYYRLLVNGDKPAEETDRKIAKGVSVAADQITRLMYLQMRRITWTNEDYKAWESEVWRKMCADFGEDA